MYVLKGFVNIPDFVSNVKGEVATFGEISTNSLTYAKETGLYYHQDYDNSLHVFKSTDTDAGDISVPQEFVTDILSVFDLVFAEQQNGEINPTTTSEGVASIIEAEYGDRVENVTVGAMRTDDVTLPEWISFDVIDEGTFVKFWLCNEAFAKQYDEYEYEFISPIEDLNDFYRTQNQVRSLIESTTIKETLERVDNIRGEYPFTKLVTQEYSWAGARNEGADIRTSWVIMIYGPAGNDPDAIREALIEWIIENSSHNREEWLAVFPGIFTPTEFMVVPLWHQYAVPDQTIQDGLNSPTIRISDAINASQRLFIGIGYEDDYLSSDVTIAQSPFQTLAFLAIGSSANRNGITNFRHLFPDYVGVSVQSNEFSRLEDRTQEWMRQIVDAILVASEMSTVSEIPQGYSRIVRQGIVYTVFEYDDMQYLVATKESVIDEMGVEQPYQRPTDAQ